MLQVVHKSGAHAGFANGQGAHVHLAVGLLHRQAYTNDAALAAGHEHVASLKVGRCEGGKEVVLGGVEHEGELGRHAAVKHVHVLMPFVGARHFNLRKIAVARHVEGQLLAVHACPVSTVLGLFVEAEKRLRLRNEETQGGSLAVESAVCLVQQVGGEAPAAVFGQRG